MEHRVLHFGTHKTSLMAACMSAVLGMAPVSAQAPFRDPAPHAVRSIAVQPGVSLEVLDYGGTGPAIVFLAGLGNTAHSFDSFAPRFSDRYHVYAITRRGFGASSHPDSGYDSGTRARDIRAVLDSLRIQTVVLLGHSIAGDELSRFAVDYPERVRALVYLDAYSYGEESFGRRITRTPVPPQAQIEMSAADSASLESATKFAARAVGVPFPMAEIYQTSKFDENGRLQPDPPGKGGLVVQGTVRSDFGRIRAPALGVFATAQAVSMFTNYASFDEKNREMAQRFAAEMDDWATSQRKRFSTELVNRTVVEVPGGHHYIHLSHPDVVERAIRGFLRRVTPGAGSSPD